METGEAIEVADAAPLDGDSTSPEVRDYEAEARSLGWTPKDDFKGDDKRWIDAETFVKRGEEVMPLLKAQNKKLRQDMDEMKRQLRKASEHFAKSEERAYQRALSEIEQKHAEAVDVGDHSAAKAAVREMRELEKGFEAAKDALPDAPADDKPTPEQLRAEFSDWLDTNDWYVLDDKKRAYADLQAERMGPAEDWKDGRKSWFDELAKRVDTKFSERPPVVNTGPGTRSPAKDSGGKSYASLPPEAKKICDKWVSQGLIKSRDDYVKSYQWD